MIELEIVRELLVIALIILAALHVHTKEYGWATFYVLMFLWNMSF